MRVVAGIIKKSDKILIVQRLSTCKREPDKWEFPGGKIEKEETPEIALSREIKEELGLGVEVGELFGGTVKDYGKEQIFIFYYFVKITKNKKIRLNGCQNFKWVKLDDTGKFDFADADKRILQLLLLEHK